MSEYSKTHLSPADRRSVDEAFRRSGINVETLMARRFDDRFRWALNISAKSSHKHILTVVAGLCNDNCFTWLGKPTLARATGLSEKSVERILHELRDLGLLILLRRYDEYGKQSSNVILLACGLPTAPHGRGRVESATAPHGRGPVAPAPHTAPQNLADCSSPVRTNPLYYPCLIQETSSALSGSGLAAEGGKDSLDAEAEEELGVIDAHTFAEERVDALKALLQRIDWDAVNHRVVSTAFDDPDDTFIDHRRESVSRVKVEILCAGVDAVIARCPEFKARLESVRRTDAYPAGLQLPLNEISTDYEFDLAVQWLCGELIDSFPELGLHWLWAVRPDSVLRWDDEVGRAIDADLDVLLKTGSELSGWEWQLESELD